VGVAFEILRRHDFLDAARAYSDALKDAARAGNPAAYHETITPAFLALIAERMGSTKRQLFGRRSSKAQAARMPAVRLEAELPPQQHILLHDIAVGGGKRCKVFAPAAKRNPSLAPGGCQAKTSKSNA
jgi:hypothetical protein